MARHPIGRAALVGPQAFNEDGVFIARRPFRINGRMVGRGEEVTVEEAGSVQGMRRLVQSRHVMSAQRGAALPEGLDVPQPHPDAFVPPEEGVDPNQAAYTLLPGAEGSVGETDGEGGPSGALGGVAAPAAGGEPAAPSSHVIAAGTGGEDAPGAAPAPAADAAAAPAPASAPGNAVKPPQERAVAPPGKRRGRPPKIATPDAQPAPR